MNNTDAIEQAYRNGYEDGKRDAVRHGHWIDQKEAKEAERYDMAYCCSVCGRCDWDCTESESFNFCPACGAKMDGEIHDKISQDE